MSTGTATEPAATRAGRVRRVVTGHDEHGRSVLLADGPAPNVFRSTTVEGLGSAVAWVSPPGGATNDGQQDVAAGDVEIAMFPAVGGTIFRVADFPPDESYRTDHDPASMFDEIGGPEARLESDGAAPRHFWYHRTDSLDYAVVLEGEIWMILDEGECLVRAGDVVVQRGTSHAWSNRSGAPCRMAFVLIGTPPVAGAPAGAPGHPDR